jgi:uncharacterized protein (TIGR00299 family) protein
VHFHEVGAVDSIVDIVGTCAALELLGIEQLHASAVATGTGMVRAAHGLIPNPAPAVVELLRDAPTYGIDTTVELTTPTGAALLAALCTGWGPMPPMRITGSGFGAGTTDTEHRPNAVQVVLGALAAAGEPGQPVMLLETNVDDTTGEVLAHTVAEVLRAGALDAWLTPVLGKKGRPAQIVSVLCSPVAARAIADVLARETGSSGVRSLLFERWTAARRIDEVEVEGHAVRVKVTAGRAKAEHDDAARVARRLGWPLRDVIARAEEQWRAGRPADDPDGATVAPGDVVAMGSWLHDHPHDHAHPHDHDLVDPPDDAG